MAVSKCVATRMAKYQMTQVVDRDTAYDLLASFHLPLFSAHRPDGPYGVSVRAIVAGGGAKEFTTGILAKADVEP
jgi:hypothetical protein